MAIKGFNSAMSGFAGLGADDITSLQQALNAPIDTGSWWMPIGIRRMRADADVARRRDLLGLQELDQRRMGLGVDRANAQANMMSSQASMLRAQVEQQDVASRIRQEDARIQLEKDKLDQFRNLTAETDKAALDMEKAFGPAFDQDFNDVISTFQGQLAELGNGEMVKDLRGKSFKAFLDAAGSGAMSPTQASDAVMGQLEAMLGQKVNFRRQQAFLNTLPPEMFGTPLRALNPLSLPSGLAQRGVRHPGTLAGILEALPEAPPGPIPYENLAGFGSK